ncbi:MAG: hypothetical protein L3J59_06395 [Methylococcaceae bacterium]|nr:hypothetical protein [Methylococcaceae bacterium]
MESIIIFSVIFFAFAFSLTKHISAIMYPLSAILFYVYLPILYASSRINILHHKKEKEVFHIKFYPMELGLWLASTCFLAFVISHLLADLLFHHLEHLYHFTYFLIILGLGGIVYCELDVNKLHISSKKTAFELQGKFLSFEIFFIIFIFFAMNH